MTVYYADIDQTGTGGDGSLGDSWHADTFRSALLTLIDGDIVNVKGSHDYGSDPFEFGYIVSITIQPWIDVYRIKSSSFIHCRGGSIAIGGIFECSSPFTFIQMDNSGSFRSCYLIADWFISSSGSNIVKGCIIKATSEIGVLYGGTIAFIDSILSGPIWNSFTGCTATNCTFTDTLPAGTTNCQGAWTPPVWPAWDAARSSFSSSILSGINTPPEPGNPPYVGYETGLWKSTRIGIGAMDFTSSEPPVIDVQPQNQKVKIGDTLTLSVTAHGTGTLHYQWKQDGSNVGTDSASYVKADFANIDRGTYTVDVTDDVDTTVSDDAVVTTNPKITTQPKTKKVKVGGVLSLSVVATGYAPITYQWNKGGSPLSGKTSSSLSISPYADSDKGSYTCDVTCDGNTVTSDAAVITTSTSTETTVSAVLNGQPVTLVGCSSSGRLQYMIYVTADNKLNIVADFINNDSKVLMTDAVIN